MKCNRLVKVLTVLVHRRAGPHACSSLPVSQLPALTSGQELSQYLSRGGSLQSPPLIPPGLLLGI